MSAVQEAIGQRERGQGPLRRLIRWPSGWPLLAMPASLIVYVLVVLACDMALIGWELAATPPRPGDLLLTGTPGGVGNARKPPVYLQPGQTLRTVIEGLGECVNQCVVSG